MKPYRVLLVLVLSLAFLLAGTSSPLLAGQKDAKPAAEKGKSCCSKAEQKVCCPGKDTSAKCSAAAKCDPAKCDPAKCDPAKCKPSAKCDPAKCAPAKAGCPSSGSKGKGAESGT